MKQEVEVRPEIQQDRLPTTLTLSPHVQSEREKVKSRFFEFQAHGQNVERIGRSLARLNAISATRLERLHRTFDETSQQAFNILSSITCGEVYLKMLEDKELAHLSPQELMEFFTLCLEVNVVTNEQVDVDVEKRGEDRVASAEVNFIKIARSSHSPRTVIAPFFNEVLAQKIGSPPSWFKGKQGDWKHLVASHSTFFAYLNSETARGVQTGQIPTDSLPIYNTGIALRGEFPDWFLERNGKSPTKVEVEQELGDDQEQLKKTSDQESRISKDVEYMTHFYSKKRKGVVERMHEMYRQLFFDNPNFSFSDPVFYFDIAYNINPVFLTSSNIKIRPFEMVHERVTRGFSNSRGIVVTKEPIALFIEKRLREKKIIDSAQEKIDDKFIGLFVRLLDGRDLSDLRETDKRAFNFLNFDIKPLIEVLPPEAVSFLLEILTVSKGEKIESFIWEVADAVSSYLRNNPKIANAFLKEVPDSVLNGIKSYTTGFLMNHWQWAYDQYRKSLLSNGEDVLPAVTEQQPLVGLNTEEETREIEDKIEEIKKGNLAGWRVFYAKNKDIQPEHLTEIEGETIEEREEALEHFLLSENVASSIKPGSIIRAFEWLVTVPQEVEQIRMRKDVEGVVFKKLKRGKVRIFYVTDNIKKNIVFFLHQKQAQSYGF